MKNEKGSTLLLVLVIIVVITTLGMVLGSMTLSTRLQFNKTDRLNVATDLAEMGITYIDKKIDQITFAANKVAKEKTIVYMKDPINNGKTKEQILNEYSRLFCVELRNTELNLSRGNYKKIYDIEEGRTFELTKQFDEIVATECQSKDEIPLKFISTGTDGEDSNSIEVVVYLTKDKGSGSGGSPGGNTPGGPAPTEGDFDKEDIITYIIDKDDFKDQNPITYGDSTYFKTPVSIEPGNVSLIIKGDGYFASEVDMHGNTTLRIYGDAFFTSPINEEKNENATSFNICVKGNTYLVVNGKLTAYNIIDKHTNGCEPFPIDESDVNLADMDWTSEDKEIDVTY